MSELKIGHSFLAIRHVDLVATGVVRLTVAVQLTVRVKGKATRVGGCTTFSEIFCFGKM